jgi:pimeloyl-ACP methyl ester carboxylesterase/DNA-binding winged helix-turn-helix (wHTH) protein
VLSANGTSATTTARSIPRRAAHFRLEHLQLDARADELTACHVEDRRRAAHERRAGRFGRLALTRAAIMRVDGRLPFSPQMIYRFDGFELDTATRELRAQGSVRALQPQAFAVLAYLVQHHERAVTKAELLEKLWPDVVVGHGSLQRAISLARAAIEDEGERIRTIPKHGYRFVAAVEEVLPERGVAGVLRPRFARAGDVHIAYHTIGDGPLDILLVLGWAFPMRALFDHPEARKGIEELAELGRVIVFDKRGTGMSDRVKQLPSLEQRMDDLRAVLAAVDSRDTVIVGFSEGGPLALLYATSHPERTRGLLLVGSFARWAGGEHGWSDAFVARLRAYIRASWGAGETIRAIAQSRADDPEVAAWAARAEQEGASPGAALELLAMNLQIDVRALLPVVSVPTVVLHHTHDAVIDVANGRELAARIPGARLMEVDGRDHVFWFEDRDRLRDAVRWVAQQGRGPRAERFLATILAVHAEHADGVDAIVAGFRAMPASAPLCFGFDGPRHALACAHALLRALGDRIAIGIHTAEVSRVDGVLVGHAVEDAAAIASAADAGQVLVSRIVAELVHGSSLHFGHERDVVVDGRTIATRVSLVPVSEW